MDVPDYGKSISFLGIIHPDTFWTLTAVHPDERGAITESFTGADDAELLPWLEEHGATSNIYYALNPLLRPLSSKARREDVATMAWVHVDVDPRAGEDLEEERTRALRVLESPPAGVPKPTIIVFSGGGFQALWKLDEPITINGKEEAYEDAKRYNQRLETLFGADHCHNVDRIMRLPGTINRPNSKKRAKGRTEVLATLVEWVPERVYPITDFTPAQVVQTSQTGFSAPRVRVSGNVQRVSDLEALPDGVTDKCKIVIAQGCDPDNPTTYESRSESLFFVCCDMIRAGVDDETIYAIISDPDWKISESVLDKGSQSQRYALRQIERARDNAIDPMLREMNEKHAVIRNFGGKPRVIEEVYDEGIQRWRLTKSTFGDIKDGYCNIRVDIGEDAKGNPRYMPLGQWWLQHENRRSFERITFAPGVEVSSDVYNMWRGFAVEDLPGDKHQSFLTHVLNNVCSGDENLYEYVLGWLANTVQAPGTPGHTSLVMRGDQGVGKGFFAHTIGHLFGRHYLAISNAQHLTGNFNNHLRDCVILFADEAFYAGDKRHTSVLKTIITEPTLMVEAKGVDGEISRNCLHVIMASNDRWVIPAGMNERRFCVLDVSAGEMQNDGYFKAIADDLEDGGYENLLHALMSRDLSNFNVRKVPQTDALRDQKIHSLSAEEEWWFNKLTDGHISPLTHSWIPTILCHDLIEDYVEYTKKFNVTRRGNATALGRFLKEACPPSFTRTQSAESVIVIQADGAEITIDRPYMYVLPDLKACRDWWDEKFGGPYDWDEVIEGSPQGDIPF